MKYIYAKFEYYEKLIIKYYNKIAKKYWERISVMKKIDSKNFVLKINIINSETRYVYKNIDMYMNIPLLNNFKILKFCTRNVNCNDIYNVVTANITIYC